MGRVILRNLRIKSEREREDNGRLRVSICCRNFNGGHSNIKMRWSPCVDLLHTSHCTRYTVVDEF